MFEDGAMVDRVPMRDMARQVPSRAASTLPVTRPARPPSVSAWIVDGRGRDVEVAGSAIAWTSRTVLVRYVDANGREGTVWVWASAVTRR
jgi:hypothetical protein